MYSIHLQLFICKFAEKVKKHHCRSCHKRFCGQCSKIDNVSTLMIQNNADEANSHDNKQLSERFRLCFNCHDIFNIADDIFLMVKHRKEKMFELYSDISIDRRKCSNKQKNHNQAMIDDSENFGSFRPLAPRRAVLKDCTNQLPPPLNPNPYSHLLKSQHKLHSDSLKSKSKNVHHNDYSYENTENEEDNGLCENIRYEDDEQMFKKHAFWYHLSPGEKDRLRKKIYIPPSSDDLNAFYFVGNQRIVRRTK